MVQRPELETATELMLDLAGIRPGQRVLDIAAGTGVQTLPAARRVGPDGRVVAVDISTADLSVLDETARRVGLDHIETRVMDGGALDFPSDAFDVVISRFGLVFLNDLDIGLAGIWRVLRPGGRIAAITSATVTGPLRLVWESIRRVGGGPSIDVVPPVPLRLGRLGLLSAAYERAGFTTTDDLQIDYVRTVASASEYVRLTREQGSPFSDEMRGFSDGQVKAVWSTLELELRRLETADGLVVPGHVRVVAGRKTDTVIDPKNQ